MSTLTTELVGENRKLEKEQITNFKIKCIFTKIENSKDLSSI